MGRHSSNICHTRPDSPASTCRTASPFQCTITDYCSPLMPAFLTSPESLEPRARKNILRPNRGRVSPFCGKLRKQCKERLVPRCCLSCTGRAPPPSTPVEYCVRPHVTARLALPLCHIVRAWCHSIRLLRLISPFNNKMGEPSCKRICAGNGLTSTSRAPFSCYPVLYHSRPFMAAFLALP